MTRTESRPERTSAFDHLAESYDDSFTQSAVGRALRNLVWSRLDECFRTGQRVLELGCGTGEDALWLAEKGVEVVATDASAKMIDRARAKQGMRAGPAKVSFHCVAMENLSALRELPRFDAVLSNFGAVNCVTDIRALSSELAGLLAPDARLIWVVMGRHVPWEWLWYLAKAQPHKALRRYQENGTLWRGMTISYPTPRQLARMLAPHFQSTRVSPLGWALPPSYASGWLDRSPRILAALTRLESITQGSSMLASAADHYMFEARLRTAH